MRLIFQTRFSFLGKLSWRSETSRLPELLFAPDRMKRRFELFEKVMLPSIADQTDDDFEVVILTSEILPTRYFDRLKHLCDDFLGNERVTILQSPPARSWRVVQNHMQETYSETDHLAQVNLDDDDAVAVDFVEVCKAQAIDALRADYFDEPWRLLSFANGYDVNFIDGFLSDISGCHMPLTAPGLCLAGPAGTEMSPMVQLQRQSPIPNSLIINTERPFFVKSLHDYNDKTHLGNEPELGLNDFSDAQTYFPALLDSLSP